jgi:hypothetical protein
MAAQDLGPGESARLYAGCAEKVIDLAVARIGIVFTHKTCSFQLVVILSLSRARQKIVACQVTKLALY